ncbi:glycosyltransferase family 4 protein [Aquihabitans daechungensis]|uniref:glycosyltransferase family 4 protein n=1 Tax=Aquihabitans daechungensis TaxID=1052257 RepID=UPI003BA1F5CD
MPRPLRIAFLKPEFGVAGGLEAVVGQLEAIARADGHEVARLGVDMRTPSATVAGLDIPRPVWNAAPEYFPYLAGRAEFDRLDVRRYDLVVSTQSPSFSVRHPRHLSVFYHHHRVYYDLEEAYLRAGFAADETVHREAGKLIRELDQPCLERVGWFLAGSATVADRIAGFNGLTDASVFHAGRIVGEERPAAPTPGTGAVLSVGRHEFPKRTELVVAAAHLLPDIDVALVGTGGREAWAKALDHRLATTDADPAALTEAETWCNTGQGANPVPEGHRSNVEFAGRVTDVELARRFAEAPCVVAPAFNEDYGLTAIEAMAQAKPVIVCADGGGLTELVEHERTGLIVEPTPAAIAAAIDRLASDRDLAAELGANGLQRAAELSWDAAADEFRAGMERVMA